MKSTSGSTSIAGSNDRALWKKLSGFPWNRAVALIALGLWTLGSAVASGSDAGVSFVQNPDFRFGVRVELVSVFATVQDRAGRLVTGLGRDDFVIYDNGTPQTISQFSREYIPLSVLILLDNSSSMDSGKKLDNAKRALVQFLKRLQPGDEAMLMTFRARSRIVQPFTQDLGRLTKELKKLEASGSTALYDAILSALDETRGAHNRRRSLLLISDGLNTYGRTQLNETVSRLRREGVELFAIGLESDLPEDLQDRAVTRMVLDQLTKSAGGETFAVSNSKELARICATISDRMHNQYALAYYPPKTKDGLWRSIRVETKAPGLKVIASKKGYFPLSATSARP